LLFLFLLLGCAAPERLQAVPQVLQGTAVVEGMTGIRYWQTEDLALLQQDALDAYAREAKLAAAARNNGSLAPANFLAISGGGEDGAFGAGLLVGWTETGTRPEFKVVTGVSTGRLAPPSPSSDPNTSALKAIYTTITPGRTQGRGLLAALFRTLWQTTRRSEVVAKFVTAKLRGSPPSIPKAARFSSAPPTSMRAGRHLEHRQNRCQGTRRRRAGAKILIASAAIPAAFPPMMIDV
jgi:hypothetical protein